MPDLVGLLGESNAADLTASGVIEEAKLDLLRVLRKKSEVHTFSIPGCAERIRLTRPDDRCHTSSLSCSKFALLKESPGTGPRYSTQMISKENAADNTGVSLCRAYGIIREPMRDT